jgi:ethanolaminephosphotransferase
MQFLGMTGHFGLGNTNSLASIDVAGAFIVSFTYTLFSVSSFPFLQI